ARENSATLRRLAGQVSAAGLGEVAQARVDDALADDDPAALLSPLADARAELRESHAALANQIGTMNRQTDRVRKDTRDLRSR
ncbi:MAG: HSP18 transcriptional regulator, partial [Actinophytocola sp.]